MQSQPGPRAAKEFLVRCIVDEAQREGVPLSETERDMLYFSETHWTLPNILEINEAFERDYDQSSYETKIAALIRNFKSRAAEDSAAVETWNDSVHTLKSEDHYILVMIAIADTPSVPRQTLKLLAIGVAGAIAAL